MRLGLLVGLLNLAIFSLWAQLGHAETGRLSYPISCENPADCPGWVVGLSSSQGGKYSVCSGALIAPDIVATNLHCLPAEIQFVDKGCRDQISLHFPKTDSLPAETVECEKVLSISPPLQGEFIRPDYAFLKLAKTLTRPQVKYSQKGFPDMSLVTIYKVDPIKTATSTTGLIKKVQCKSIQNSIMNPYFKNDLSPLVLMSPCPIIPGNSGSGLIASDGSIRGVISAETEFLIPPALKAQMKVGLETLQGASGSNFSCIPYPLEGVNAPQFVNEPCKVRIDEPMRKDLVEGLLRAEIEKSLKEINERVNEQMKSIRIGGSQLVYWKAQKAKVDQAERDEGLIAKAQVRPFCLLPGMQNLNEYADKLKAQTTTISMKISEFRIREKYDLYFRYQAVVEEKKFDLKVYLIPKDLLKKKGIDVRLSFEDATTKSEEIFKLDLCQTLPSSAPSSAGAGKNQ